MTTPPPNDNDWRAYTPAQQSNSMRAPTSAGRVSDHPQSVLANARKWLLAERRRAAAAAGARQWRVKRKNLPSSSTSAPRLDTASLYYPGPMFNGYYDRQAPPSGVEAHTTMANVTYAPSHAPPTTTTTAQRPEYVPSAADVLDASYQYQHESNENKPHVPVAVSQAEIDETVDKVIDFLKFVHNAAEIYDLIDFEWLEATGSEPEMECSMSALSLSAHRDGAASEASTVSFSDVVDDAVTKALLELRASTMTPFPPQTPALATITNAGESAPPQRRSKAGFKAGSKSGVAKRRPGGVKRSLSEAGLDGEDVEGPLRGAPRVCRET